MIQMKLILITLAFLITFISAHHNTEGYYPLETVCSSNTTCASNSFCDLSEGLCVCNYGWATKDGSTCSFKLRCQQTLLLAHGVLGLYGTGYYYLGLKSLGTAMAALSFLIVGLPITLPWGIIAGILFAQNHYQDENGFYPLIGNCA